MEGKDNKGVTRSHKWKEKQQQKKTKNHRKYKIEQQELH
jgi:hypothetical protein